MHRTERTDERRLRFRRRARPRSRGRAFPPRARSAPSRCRSRRCRRCEYAHASRTIGRGHVDDPDDTFETTNGMHGRILSPLISGHERRVRTTDTATHRVAVRDDHRQLLRRSAERSVRPAVGPLGDDGEPTGAISDARPCRNADASAVTYTIDPRDMLAAMRAAEAAGHEIVGVWHSHTHTEGYPSPTDVRQAVRSRPGCT